MNCIKYIEFDPKLHGGLCLDNMIFLLFNCFSTRMVPKIIHHQLHLQNWEKDAAEKVLLS